MPLDADIVNSKCDLRQVQKSFTMNCMQNQFSLPSNSLWQCEVYLRTTRPPRLRITSRRPRRRPPKAPPTTPFHPCPPKRRPRKCSTGASDSRRPLSAPRERRSIWTRSYVIEEWIRWPKPSSRRQWNCSKSKPASCGHENPPTVTAWDQTPRHLASPRATPLAPPTVWTRRSRRKHWNPSPTWDLERPSRLTRRTPTSTRCRDSEIFRTDSTGPPRRHHSSRRAVTCSRSTPPRFALPASRSNPDDVDDVSVSARDNIPECQSFWHPIVRISMTTRFCIGSLFVEDWGSTRWCS